MTSIARKALKETAARETRRAAARQAAAPTPELDPTAARLIYLALFFAEKEWRMDEAQNKIGRRAKLSRAYLTADGKIDWTAIWRDADLLASAGMLTRKTLTKREWGGALAKKSVSYCLAPGATSPVGFAAALKKASALPATLTTTKKAKKQ